MGVNVLAPVDTVWAFPSGNLYVGPSRYDLTMSADKWVLFKPGG
jgi:hypothetical protein